MHSGNAEIGRRGKKSDGWAFSGLALSFFCFPFLVSDCSNWKTSELCDLLLWFCGNFPLCSRLTVSLLLHCGFRSFSQVSVGGCPKSRSAHPSPEQQIKLHRQCMIRTLAPVCAGDGKHSILCCLWLTTNGSRSDWCLWRNTCPCLLYWNVPLLIRWEAALGAEGGAGPGSLLSHVHLGTDDVSGCRQN